MLLVKSFTKVFLALVNLLLNLRCCGKCDKTNSCLLLNITHLATILPCTRFNCLQSLFNMLFSYKTNAYLVLFNIKHIVTELMMLELLL